MDPRCPKKLKSLPEEPCDLGREAIDKARAGCEGGCPWFIADRESNYCFFKFVADHGRPLQPPQIAQKLLMDDSEVKKIVTNFRKKAADWADRPKSSKKSPT